MATIEEIEDQLRERQQAGADLVVEGAWAIHRAEQQYAGALKTIDQYSEMISRQRGTILGQENKISELKAELAELRAKNST